MFLPVINGTITLTDGTAEQDFYATARLGADLRHKLSKPCFACPDGGHREYLSTDGQELTDYGVGAGLDYTVGDDAFSFDTSCAVRSWTLMTIKPYRHHGGLATHLGPNAALGGVRAAQQKSLHTRHRFR